MSFDPDQAFELMRCMYTSGVLDKFTAIQGEALSEVMADAGLNVGDVLNTVDQASESSIAAVDRLLGMSGPFMKYLASERLMRFVSRMLDVSLVRRQALKGARKSLLRALTAEASS